MRKKYFILTVCSVLLLSGVALALYLYSKPHSNVARLTPAFRMDANELYGEYRRDEAGADRRLTGKVIEVNGIISDQHLTDSSASIQLNTMDPGVMINCSFLWTGHAKISFPPKGSPVTIKGRCIGFLIDVNLVDCVLEQQGVNQ